MGWIPSHSNKSFPHQIFGVFLYLPVRTHAVRRRKKLSFPHLFLFIFFLQFMLMLAMQLSHSDESFPLDIFLNSFTHACCTYIESKKTSFFFQLVIGVSSKNLPHFTTLSRHLVKSCLPFHQNSLPIVKERRNK